jgi:hypothetical protein
MIYHIGAIVYYNYYIFCYMMMNEQLTMFKCKSNWNSHKNISYCASKLSTQKTLKQIKFQLKDANNVNSKKQFKYANIPSMNNFEIMIFDIVSFFFCLVTFIGFQCSISNTPCNFERFCIGNSTYSNCHNKVVIFFKSCPCALWDEPHPPCQMPMMPNNMLEVKHTNEGRHTFYIYCTVLYIDCSKYKHS